MTDEEFETKQQELRDKGFEFDCPVKEYKGYSFGTRIVPIEDDENSGVYAGTEGYLGFEQVGAPEHNNVRTIAVYFEEGYDGGSEIQMDNFEVIE